jgi:hypothetical protein
MGTVTVSWVRLGAGTRTDGPQNCVVETIGRETFSSSGTSAQSGAAPAHANAAIVETDVAISLYYKSGESNPTATSALGMNLGADKQTVLAGINTGDKIAAITV